MTTLTPNSRPGEIDTGATTADPAGSAPSSRTKSAERRGKPSPAVDRRNAWGTAKSKTELVLKRLRLAKGASIEQLMETTGWQAHSVRGFLSGTVKKKLGLILASETGKDGVRRYRIIDAVAG